ncbi:hypothetical protein [Dictyobacter kobayashii]|uniref:Uncharacterized protein n=1 Tax=Dictyobacter kobayashii TaxID=2014872 RepID=A0A402AHN0_9CHLR|nr:hypothetical protein [Dictyobacter kobayashii]GCE18631.1 hypothetical protein KDK_24310 [Dictyobacter kobayashii]
MRRIAVVVAEDQRIAVVVNRVDGEVLQRLFIYAVVTPDAAGQYGGAVFGAVFDRDGEQGSVACLGDTFVQVSSYYSQVQEAQRACVWMAKDKASGLVRTYRVSEPAVQRVRRIADGNEMLTLARFLLDEAFTLAVLSE